MSIFKKFGISTLIVACVLSGSAVIACPDNHDPVRSLHTAAAEPQPETTQNKNS